MGKEKTKATGCIEGKKYESPAIYSEVVFCDFGAECRLESSETGACKRTRQEIKMVFHGTVLSRLHKAPL